MSRRVCEQCLLIFAHAVYMQCTCSARAVHTQCLLVLSHDAVTHTVGRLARRAGKAREAPHEGRVAG